MSSRVPLAGPLVEFDAEPIPCRKRASDLGYKASRSRQQLEECDFLGSSLLPMNCKHHKTKEDKEQGGIQRSRVPTANSSIHIQCNIILCF